MNKIEPFGALSFLLVWLNWLNWLTQLTPLACAIIYFISGLHDSSRLNLFVMEEKKILSFIILNGVVCPVYDTIDSDVREEWND